MDDDDTDAALAHQAALEAQRQLEEDHIAYEAWLDELAAFLGLRD